MFSLFLTSVGLLNVVMIVTDIIFKMRWRASVKGSHNRFFYGTAVRITSWAVLGLFAFQGLLRFAEHNIVFGVLDIVFSTYLLNVEMKRKKDDDDWFTGRGKKIKNGLKKALTVNVRSTAPSFS